MDALKFLEFDQKIRWFQKIKEIEELEVSKRKEYSDFNNKKRKTIQVKEKPRRYLLTNSKKHLQRKRD